MKNQYYLTFCFTLFIIIAVGCGAIFKHTGEPDITGIWKGKVIATSGEEQSGEMKVFKKPDGTLTATIDSHDGGITGLQTDEITIEKNVLRFVIHSIGGVFHGIVKDNGSLIEGEWLINNEKYRVILSKEQ
ncbi:hypothetical protein ACFL4V_01330 [Candidatus Latescibacterota bacterium]